MQSVTTPLSESWIKRETFFFAGRLSVKLFVTVSQRQQQWRILFFPFFIAFAILLERNTSSRELIGDVQVRSNGFLHADRDVLKQPKTQMKPR